MADFKRSHGRLADAVRALADDEANYGASRRVEAALRQAVRTLAQSRRRQRAAFLAVAASLLVVTAAAWALVVRHAPPVSSGHRTATREVATEFLPLTYGGFPMTDAYVIRIEVPRSALVTFGLAAADMLATSDEVIDADVIVGADGFARAVRFVHQGRNEE